MLCQIVALGSRPCWEPFSTEQHEAEKLCQDFSGIKTMLGNHFQVFKKVKNVDIKQKIFFDISILFWDQDHVERSFKFLKKVRAKS